MNWMLAALVGALQLLCLASLPRAAAGAELPQTGLLASGHIALFGKRIPLPPGEWRVAAASFARVTGEDPGPYGTIGGVMLTRAAEDPEREFVLIRTNAVPVRSGWGPPAECLEGAALWQSVAEPRDLHTACAYVMPARSARIAAWIGDPSIKRLLPPWALVAGFRASDRNDVVEARYGVVPTSKAQAAWFGTWQTLEPSQKALLERLGDWARRARQASFAALRDPADQVPSIPPMMLATGAAAVPGETVSPLQADLYDLATYRGPVTVWNWALASTLTGNIYVGATIAAWQSLTHNALYSGNEMAWDWSRDIPTMNFVAARPVRHGDAADQSDPAPGGFTLDGKQVPLPSGTWTVLATDTGPAASGVVLGQLEGKVLRGLAVAHANLTKTAEIFATASDCSRTDLYFATIRYDTPADGYCTYAKPVTPEDASADDQLWARARIRLLAEGVDVPPVFLAVGARARTGDNFADVRYYFPPDDAMIRAGLTGAQLGAGRIAAAPVLLEHVVALQAWADLVQLPLEQGVRGRLPGVSAELPWPWQMAAVRDALVSQAHAPLERLRQAGALDDAELQRQLALADATLAERERQRWSLWARSTYKVATYRVLSYFDSVAVSWFITFSPEQSLAYATINAVAQPIMAYANAHGWVGSGAGQGSLSLQPIDFPELGRDRL
jgi:hypothetical protein